jgi:hypothetical protein
VIGVFNQARPVINGLNNGRFAVAKRKKAKKGGKKKK